MSLTEDAAAQRKEHYNMLVGTLQRHFDIFNEKESLSCGFKQCVRQQGEPFQSPAYKIGGLGRCAYSKHLLESAKLWAVSPCPARRSSPTCNTAGDWLLFRKKGPIQSWLQQNCQKWPSREPPWKAERLHIRDLLATFPFWTNVSRAPTLRFIWCVGSAGMIPRCQFQPHHSEMIQPSSSPHPQPPARRSLGGCLNHLVTEWVSHTWLSLTLIVTQTQLHPCCFLLAVSWWPKPSEKLYWGCITAVSSHYRSTKTFLWLYHQFYVCTINYSL